MLDGSSLVISELMAANSQTLADEDGDSSDWLEIHNPTSAPVDLDGWYLTDDDNNLTQWQFPDVTLNPQQYLLVFASGKDRSAVGSELHANFQLDSDGEYLALVESDGTTIAHEFAPEFPKQFTDISYGIGYDEANFAVPGGESLRFLVPADDSLGAGWTDPNLDDSAWTTYAQSAGILITEAGTGTPDSVELQNVSANTVDTTGWVMAANSAANYEINDVHALLWTFPASMAPGELIYRPDTTEDNIFWRSSDEGWVMILDQSGAVVDFVVWGYPPEDLASMSVDLNGFTDIHPAANWAGPPVDTTAAGSNALQRIGSSDHDHAGDWTFDEVGTGGTLNEGLTIPFVLEMSVGLGFDAAAGGIGDVLQADLGADMHGVNASAYMRLPFEVADPLALQTLTLSIKYNDGFVAYLNGQEVARRNAPATVQWDSAATAARSVADSLVFEEIDLANFLGLLQPGNNLLAIAGLNVSASDGDFLIQPILSGTGLQYFAEPTPGDQNGAAGWTDYVRDTTFSVDRGFYDAPFDVLITTNTPNAQIYFTTDGSEPNDTNGTLYTGPIQITTTTTLRAAALKSGYKPSNVDTQTYLFLADVLQQPVWPEGFPTAWNNGVGVVSAVPAPADYEMDPAVVNAAPFTDAAGLTFDMTDALEAIPTVSLVMDLDDLFDLQTGIYANAQQEGIAWERSASLEYFDPNSGQEFQINSGVRMHGGWNRFNEMLKKSFRIYFRNEYDGALNFPLFPDTMVERFEKIVLRSGNGKAWPSPWRTDWQLAQTQYLRDQFSRDAQRDMGQLTSHGKFVHLYINGLYWGLYNPVERPDADFGESYLGGDNDEYDVVRWRRGPGITQIDGTLAAWNAMMGIARGRIASDAVYGQIHQYLDVEAFIDYMIVNIFTANYDWPDSNAYALRRQGPDGKFYFVSWDAEESLFGLWDNRTSLPYANSAGELYEALRGNAEFRREFGDRVHRHFFNDGAMTSENNEARWMDRATEIDRAIVAESARWGDLLRATPYTRDIEWLTEQNRLRYEYFTVSSGSNRTDVVLDQFKGIALYPNVDAPAFNQHGGQVVPGFELNITAPVGTIYYTLDGSDPRLPGGALSPEALEFGAGGGTAALISTGAQWKYLDDGSDQGTAWYATNFDDAGWAAGPSQLGYGDGDEATLLGYGPDANNKYVTTYFRHTFDVPDPTAISALTLELMRDDGAVVYLNGQELLRSAMPEGDIDYLTISAEGISDPEESTFYPFSIDPSLLVAGDNVIAAEIHQCRADSSDITLDLKLQADIVLGDGPITLDNNALVKTRAKSGILWSALNEAQFITHQPANAANFAITELNYHPYDRTADEITEGFLDDDDFEFVELKNIGPIPIDLLGVRFTKGIDFDFTGGSVAQLDPGQFVLIVSNTAAFEYRYGSGANVAGQYTGQLGNGGEQLALLDTFGQTIQNFSYGDSNDAGWPNRADGNGSTLEVIDPAGDPSDPGNWRSSGELLGTPGTTGTGSFQGVVVNEVLSHTDYPLGEGPRVDAIELYNATDTDIPIGGWWLSDDSDDFQKFQIPAGTTIPAYGYVTFYEGHYEGQTLAFDPINEFGGLGLKDFALSGARGDDVWLLVDPGAGGRLQFADHVEFDSAYNGESFGRWPDETGDLYPMVSRTLDGPNSGPRIGPDVLISEVMYNAPEVSGILPENLEFIEIFNTTSQPIDLTGWRLRKGFDFDFAPGTMIGSRETLVIVAFDPSDVVKLADFRSYYGIGAEVPIVGTFGDRLSNTGEQIQLQRPDTPPANDPLYVPHPLEDQIEYLDTWYASANGVGQSLNRAGANLWGNDSASWTPEDPTPGEAEQLDTTVVTGRHVFYNNSSFGATIAQDKTALRPGEQASFANYTSYANGINGIVIDVAGLADPGAIDATDFTFKLGGDDTPGDWTDAPAPASVDATANQIILTWDDGAIRNTWLEVTVLVTPDTGLPAADVFYFGNAVGETGNSLDDARVDATDVLLTRQNPRPFFDPAEIDTPYDFNRDRRVDAIDTLIARNNQIWSGTELELIDLTVQAAAVQPEAKNARLVQPLNDKFFAKNGF